MLRQLMKFHRRYILIDVSTQRDFFSEDGCVCVRNHQKVLASIRRMMAWARKKNVFVISLCQVYPNLNGCSQRDCCLDETQGQKKIHYTLLNNRASFAADSNTPLPEDVLRSYKQIIMHERCPDPFSEPNIERLLSEIKVSEFVVIGASAEKAVKATVLGLLQRGKKVNVVVDAVGMCDKKEGNLAFSKMKAKGAKLIETRKLAGISKLKYAGLHELVKC